MRCVSLLCTLIYFIIAPCFSQPPTYFSADVVTWGNALSRTEGRDDAGLQGNQGAMSGFYETYNPTNYPAGASGWWHLLDVRHQNPGYNFAMQFSGSLFDQNLFFRKTINSPTTAWNRVVLEDPNGTTGVGRLLTRSIAYLDGDRFNYNNGNNIYAINNYGLEWNGDSWASTSGNTANLSGYGGIKLFTGSSHRMCITVGGNVGIGTTSPQEMLSVNGTIASKRVRVTQAGWPDYVFDQHYSLRKLDAVANYIQQHKHLPDVPAAAQIKKDGLDLGENQAVLLRKVEELTLYVIQLNQAVNQLREENEQQQKTITQLTREK